MRKILQDTAGIAKSWPSIGIHSMYDKSWPSKAILYSQYFKILASYCNTQLVLQNSGLLLQNTAGAAKFWSCILYIVQQYSILELQNPGQVIQQLVLQNPGQVLQYTAGTAKNSWYCKLLAAYCNIQLALQNPGQEGQYTVGMAKYSQYCKILVR